MMGSLKDWLDPASPVTWSLVAIVVIFVVFGPREIRRLLKDAGLITPPAGDEAARDPRALARLLVTEILLYNEEAAESGLPEGDRHQRLAPEIERARALFRERAGPDANERLFDQALAEILGEGCNRGFAAQPRHGLKPEDPGNG